MTTVSSGSSFIMESFAVRQTRSYKNILARDVIRGKYNVLGIGIITILKIHKISSDSEYKFLYLRNNCDMEELAICNNGNSICMANAYLIDESDVSKKKIKISELVD